VPGVECYVEPARSYRSVAYTVVLLAAGFALDLSLGGGVAHLPGWLGAAAVLLGVHVLVVYAARATRSLSLTEDELRVGDETLARATIVGAQEGAAPDTPVLGWPSGLPRAIKAVTVESADRARAVVPTRDPARLIAALRAPQLRPVEVTIRPAEAADLDLLPEIDHRAEALFTVVGMTLPDTDLPHDDALAVFVAGRPPVGFVELDEVDGLAYVREIAVLPSTMRRGIGSGLMERAAQWARDRGLPAVVLTTYAEVPWNGPWYAARGFVELAGISPGLQAIRAREIAAGLDEPGRRIVMRRDL
jgi:GNAT superfamily N-acetyltransferase